MKIGIDIGGSHVGIGLVDEFGNIQQKKEKYIVEKVENESQISKQNLKEEITQFIIQTIKEYQKMDFVENVGIAVPGTVNQTTIIKAVNLGIENYEITPIIEKETGTKVKLKLKGTKKKCKWSVNKPQIISVSQKGIVKAKKKGKAKVIAKIKKKKYICKVTVKVKKKQTDKSNSGNKSTPDTSANTNANDSTVKSLTNLYIKNVLQNNTDTWILVNTKDSSGVTYSISYQSIGANVAITLNGKTVDKTALQKGDSLEIGYTGDLPDARKSWIPHLAYLKATRA